MLRHPSTHRPERRVGAALPLLGLAFVAAAALPVAALWSGWWGGAEEPALRAHADADRPSGLPTVVPSTVPLSPVTPQHRPLLPRSGAPGPTPPATGLSPTPAVHSTVGPTTATVGTTTTVIATTSAVVTTPSVVATTTTTRPAPTNGGSEACVAHDLPSTAFAPDSIELSEDSLAQLAEIAHALAETTGLVMIDGHTDIRESGFEGGNDGLSIARAVAVRDALAERGVDPDRMVPTGHGSRVPLDEALTEDAHAKNRRVEIRTNC